MQGALDGLSGSCQRISSTLSSTRTMTGNLLTETERLQKDLVTVERCAWVQQSGMFTIQHPAAQRQRTFIMHGTGAVHPQHPVSGGRPPNRVLRVAVL